LGGEFSDQRAPRWARFRKRIAARPPAGRRVHEAIFAQALPRVRGRALRRGGKPGASMFARAVEAIPGNVIAANEAVWIEGIERRRTELARPDRIGADEVAADGSGLSLRQVAVVASIHQPWGRFRFRLVREMRPRSCIELGGGVGISTAYQGAALELNEAGVLRSIEGSAARARQGTQVLSSLGIERAEVIEGRFEDVLDRVLAEAQPVDLVYLDAGKGRRHNLDLFERVLPHLSPTAAFVMDDIHWSREMKRTWREIATHPRVQLSVDLWRIGACLLAEDPSAQRRASR
jgi:predicted O-methyltransferase YrrM